MVSPSPSAASSVHVFFATVTGNAEEIARRIAVELVARGVDAAPARSLAEFEFLPECGPPEPPTAPTTTTMVVVASTTGDGDPPDPIRPFMRRLRKAAKERAGSLAHVRYALLGLGDTNYENFCNAAKKIDAGLIAAGAKAFVPRGLADDGTGLEAVVEPWIASLYLSLDILVGSGTVQASPAPLATNEEIAPHLQTNRAPAAAAATAAAASPALLPTCNAPTSTTPTATTRPTAPPSPAGFTKPDGMTLRTSNGSTVPQVASSGSLKAASPNNDELAALVKAVAATELGFEEGDLPPLLPLSIQVQPIEKSISVSEATTAFHPPSISCHYNPETTVHARVVRARKLTPEISIKTVYHMELDCAAGGSCAFEYSPGDAFGVIVENLSDDVDRLLQHLSVDPEALHALAVARVADSDSTADSSIIAEGTVRQLIAQRVDLRAAPKKTFIRALADHCSNVEDKKALLRLCSKQGKMEYVSEIVDAQTGICDLLEKTAPSCRPPLDLLLDQLPPLTPRYYSAASAPQTDGAILHFAFSLVERGLATTALANRCELFIAGTKPDTIPHVLLVPRTSDATSSFKPPADIATPYVMIGPGTGVAPFRGFLRQRDAILREGHDAIGTAKREQSGTVGKTILFFGCRNESLDFLYGGELQSYVKSGTLNVLDTAFSRDGPSKVYVQNRLANRADEVATALASGAVVYVCGDGGGMALGVDTALRTIVRDKLCNGSEIECKSYMKNLVSERRYVRDIWYFGTLPDNDE